MNNKLESILEKDYDILTAKEKIYIRKTIQCKFAMGTNRTLTSDMVYAGWCMLKRSMLLARREYEMVTITPRTIIRDYGVFGGGKRQEIQIITKQTRNGLYSDEYGNITIGPNPADFPVIDVSYKTEKLTILTLMDTRNGQFFRITSEEADFTI